MLSVGALVAALTVVAHQANLLRPLELESVDARFAIRGKRTPPPSLVIVQVDDATFDDLGVQWPFPRSLHARLIRIISADKPLVIAYDVQFTEETKPKEDNALIRAVAEARGRIVLAASQVDARGNTNVLGGGDLLRRIGTRVGSSAIPPDQDGVLRRLPYAVDRLKSFSITVAETESGRAIGRSALGGPSAWIDYYGPPGTIPAVSFSRVVEGKVRQGFFSGKVVVVGASSGSLQDVHATATSGSQLMSGPEVEANAIETALRNFPLKPSPRGFDIGLIVFLALLVPAANVRLRLGTALGVGLLGLLALAVGVQIVFDSGWILPFVLPCLGLVAASVGVLGARYVSTIIERKFAQPAVLASEAASAGHAALGRGELERALELFGRAQRLWQEAGVPYEAARARVLLAEAHRRLGDTESAAMQLRAAKQAFERLGAVGEEREAFDALQAITADDGGGGPEPAQVVRTFMFTDIVDSTPLMEAIGDDAWAHLHRWHNDTLRELFARHGGEEVNYTGDGFFVAFTDPARGVECAVDIQRTLADHRRTHGFSPRVRVGVHTTDAIRRGKDGYEGKGVHTAARIGARATADEILTSCVTIDRIAGDVLVSRRHAVKLKGIAKPVEVASVRWGGDAEGESSLDDAPK